MARPLRIEMANGWYHVTAQVAARRLTERVAEAKALQKAMAKVMKKMPGVETCPPPRRVDPVTDGVWPANRPPLRVSPLTALELRWRGKPSGWRANGVQVLPPVRRWPDPFEPGHRVTGDQPFSGTRDAPVRTQNDNGAIPSSCRARRRLASLPPASASARRSTTP